MVFRNGGNIKNVERFYLDGNAIENVTNKYLGLPISTTLSWSPAKSILQNKQIELPCHCQIPYTSATTHPESPRHCLTDVLHLWFGHAMYVIQIAVLKKCICRSSNMYWVLEGNTKCSSFRGFRTLP